MDDYDLLNDQRPPHSLAAEQALIGAVLRCPASYERVTDKITASEFYAHSHRLHWQAIVAMMDAGQPCDVITLSEKLERDGHLADAGGLSYLQEVLNASNTSANIVAYADMVKNTAIMRAILAASSAQTADVYQPEGRTASELLGAAQARLAILEEQNRPAGGPVTAKVAAGRAIEHIDRMHQAGDGMEGVSTGWPSLDKLTRGLEPSSLIILAARPSMGKTTFAVQLAQQVATVATKPVLIFSLEMSVESLSLRMLASLGRINHDRIRSGKLEADEWPRLTAATNKMTRLDFHIDDQAGLTVRDITIRSQRLAREHGGLALIVIDYLGLIAFAGKVENQNLGIGQITAALKGLAKSLKVPVVLLSQLNRNLEQRPDKRPIMADLRDSGSIEQDADIVAFIYRDEVYRPDSADAGTAEIIIAKNRNGITKKLRMAFIGQHCRFDELAYDWQPPTTAAKPQRRSQDYEY